MEFAWKSEQDLGIVTLTHVSQSVDFNYLYDPALPSQALLMLGPSSSSPRVRHIVALFNTWADIEA
jgi:hypothetical protein